MNLEFMMSNDNLGVLFIVIIFFKNVSFLRLCLQEFLYLKSFLSHLGHAAGVKTRDLSLICFCFCQ